MQRLEQQVELQGITHDDIQRIFEQVVEQAYPNKPSLLYLDISYLYTFDLSDLPYIAKFTDRLRAAQQGNRNPLQVEWHRSLERWNSGEYVVVEGKAIKPLQIERAVDRVVNELMAYIALAMGGINNVPVMKFHAIGDGAIAGTNPSPGNTALIHEIDRIDVTEESGGGGLSVDGSTFMCVGNHPASVASGDMTEMGMFDREFPGSGGDEVPIVDDIMGDHSIFPSVVHHVQGNDALGGSIIVFQTST